MTVAAKMLPSVESSQPGTNIGRFFSQAASSQLFVRIDLIRRLQAAAADQL
jgi:hypothetical protein